MTNVRERIKFFNRLDEKASKKPRRNVRSYSSVNPSPAENSFYGARVGFSEGNLIRTQSVINRNGFGVNVEKPSGDSKTLSEDVERNENSKQQAMEPKNSSSPASHSESFTPPATITITAARPSSPFRTDQSQPTTSTSSTSMECTSVSTTPNSTVSSGAESELSLSTLSKASLSDSVALSVTKTKAMLKEVIETSAITSIGGDNVADAATATSVVKTHPSTFSTPSLSESTPIPPTTDEANQASENEELPICTETNIDPHEMEHQQSNNSCVLPNIITSSSPLHRYHSSPSSSPLRILENLTSISEISSTSESSFLSSSEKANFSYSNGTGHANVSSIKSGKKGRHRGSRQRSSSHSLSGSFSAGKDSSLSASPISKKISSLAHSSRPRSRSRPQTRSRATTHRRSHSQSFGKGKMKTSSPSSSPPESWACRPKSHTKTNSEGSEVISSGSNVSLIQVSVKGYHSRDSSLEKAPMSVDGESGNDISSSSGGNRSTRSRTRRSSRSRSSKSRSRTRRRSRSRSSKSRSSKSRSRRSSRSRSRSNERERERENPNSKISSHRLRESRGSRKRSRSRSRSASRTRSRSGSGGKERERGRENNKKMEKHHPRSHSRRRSSRSSSRERVEGSTLNPLLIKKGDIKNTLQSSSDTMKDPVEGYAGAQASSPRYKNDGDEILLGINLKPVIDKRRQTAKRVILNGVESMGNGKEGKVDFLINKNWQSGEASVPLIRRENRTRSSSIAMGPGQDFKQMREQMGLLRISRKQRFTGATATDGLVQAVGRHRTSLQKMPTITPLTHLSNDNFRIKSGDPLSVPQAHRFGGGKNVSMAYCLIVEYYPSGRMRKPTSGNNKPGLGDVTIAPTLWYSYRTYTEYANFHRVLHEKYSVAYASFPQKKSFHKEKHFVEERITAFRKFIQGILYFDFIVRSDEFLEFIEFSSNVG